MPIRPRTPPRPRSGILRHWALWAWFVLALLLTAGGVCLWRSGRMLVREDAFGHAAWALVLAGESRDCERSDAAIRLFKEGRIDTVILSSTRVFKNRYHSEFLADYMVRQGVPRDRIFEFHQDAYSTQEEAALLVGQFRLLNLDTVLVITTSFHTARARRIFRKLAQGNPVILVTAADYPIYDPAAWWTNRESRKIWFNEWAKTFFTAFELWRAAPVPGKAEYQGLIPDPFAAGAARSAPPMAVPDTAEPAAPDSASAPSEGTVQGPNDGSGADGGPPVSPSDSSQAGNAPGSETPADTSRPATGGREAAGKAEAKSESRTGDAKAGKDTAAADGRSDRETESRKAVPKPAKKPAAPAPKPPPKSDAKKTEKNRKKG